MRNLDGNQWWAEGETPEGGLHSWSVYLYIVGRDYGATHTHISTHVKKSKKLLIQSRIKITKVTTTTTKEHQEVPPKCYMIT